MVSKGMYQTPFQDCFSINGFHHPESIFAVFASSRFKIRRSTPPQRRLVNRGGWGELKTKNSKLRTYAVGVLAALYFSA